MLKALFLVSLSPEERHLHKIAGFALGCIAATVIASCRHHALVSNHLSFAQWPDRRWCRVAL